MLIILINPKHRIKHHPYIISPAAFSCGGKRGGIFIKVCNYLILCCRTTSMSWTTHWGIKATRWEELVMSIWRWALRLVWFTFSSYTHSVTFRLLSSSISSPQTEVVTSACNYGATFSARQCFNRYDSRGNLRVLCKRRPVLTTHLLVDKRMIK